MIAEKIIEICKEFGMDKKTEYINADNGSNMVASFRFMQREDEESDSDAFDPVEEDISEEHIISDDEEVVGNPLVDSSQVEASDEIVVGINLANEREEEDKIEAEVEEYVKRDREVDSELKFKGFKRLGCFDHTLQLAINKVNRMKNQVFGKVLEKSKAFVAKYRKSSRAKYILRQTNFKKRLSGFVQTRWHSDLEMCKSIVEAADMEDKPLAKLTEEMNWPVEITASDVRMLKHYITLMEPFANKTNLLGGEKYSTIQLVVPTLLELINHLEAFGIKVGGGVQKYCKKLKIEI